jgi:outer membrane murein-binding lipoprotein Lpp
MDERMNGGEVTIEPPQTGQVDRFASEVQTGLARYYQLVQRLETTEQDLRTATLDNERLRVALEGAREHERNHVQVVIDEAKINQHKAEVEVQMLRDEIGSLRHDVAAANKVAQDARAEAAELGAALKMIGANVIEMLNRRPSYEQGKAHVAHTH